METSVDAGRAALKSRVETCTFLEQNMSYTAPKRPRPQLIKLHVPVCCEECERNVFKSLLDVEGVESVKMDYKTGKVTVKGTAVPEQCLKVAKKVHYRTEFWSKDAKKDDGKKDDGKKDDKKKIDKRAADIRSEGMDRQFIDNLSAASIDESGHGRLRTVLDEHETSVDANDASFSRILEALIEALRAAWIRSEGMDQQSIDDLSAEVTEALLRGIAGTESLEALASKLINVGICLRVCDSSSTLRALIRLLKDGQHIAAIALGNLAEHSNQQGCEAIVHFPTLLQELSKALVRDVNPALQVNAARTLKFLATNGGNRVALKISDTEGSLEKLVDSLAKSGNPDLQVQAASALASLAAEGDHDLRERISNIHGSLESLSDLLVKDDNLDLRKEAERALAVLTNVVNELKNGREDGFFISTQWFFSLDKHHQEILKALFSKGGYSQLYETDTYFCLERFTEQVDMAPSSTVDVSLSTESATESVSQDSKTITAITKFVHLLGMKATLSSRIDHQQTACAGEWGKSVAPEVASSGEMKRGNFKMPIVLDAEMQQIFVPAEKAFTLETFMLLLKGISSQGFFLSSQRLSSLSDHDKKILTSACLQAGYALVSSSTTVACFERISIQAETSTKCNPGPSTEADGTGGNTNEAGTATTGEILQNGLNDLDTVSKDKPDGLANALREYGLAGKDRADNCSCLPQRLEVKSLPCSDSAVALPVPVPGPSKYNVRSRFGDTVVSLPKRRPLEPTTIIEKSFSMVGYDGSKINLQMSAHVETTFSCCVQHHQNPKMARIRIWKIQGVITNRSSMDPRPNALVLKSVRVNVDACIAPLDSCESGDDDDQIKLHLEEELRPPRRRVVEVCPQKKEGDSCDRVWLALSGTDPEYNEPGSMTIELACHVTKTSAAAANHLINANVLLFQSAQPVILEGHIENVMAEHPTAVLRFDVIYQVEVAYLEPSTTSPPTSMVIVPAYRKSKTIQFDRRLEFRTESLE